MIIWINGAYGAGKSTLAEALVGHIEDAMIFDAEEVGNAVRSSYPGEPKGVIFEDYPLWRRFCVELLKDLHKNHRRNILVPMTLLRRVSYDEIICPLRDAGIDTRLIMLEASRESVRSRILARGEDENCWCMQMIEPATSGASALPADLRLMTDSAPIKDLADKVLAFMGKNVWQS